MRPSRHTVAGVSSNGRGLGCGEPDGAGRACFRTYAWARCAV
ncbi:hypothetical protein [Streptomyces sp.]|nr:hypothetical protein [Streptomyces sp.]